MKTRRRIEEGEWRARNALECGGMTPLFPTRHVASNQSADVSAHSKTWRHCAMVLTLFSLAFSVTAQSYSIDWHTIDGGGGTSTNGQYSVTGTIGQPDAGAIRGGYYTLHGGFWSMVSVVQNPGAPWLSLTRSNSVVTVSWPKQADVWLLEYRDDLTSGAWSIIPPPYPTNAMNYSVTEPSPSGNRFYRLHKP